MSPDLLTLPTVPATGDLGVAAERRHRLIFWTKALSWLSLAWMTAEGAVGILAGVAAGSVALVGFGLDSAIEGMASVVVIWRFTAGRRDSDAAERRAQKLVALSFFLLAPYVAAEAIRTLVGGDRPQTSWVGIALALGSVALMPLLGVAKQRIGAQLGSSATRGEGTQNLLCAYLAAGVLVGLLANTLAGWWWLDPVVALGIAALAVREGRAAWRGEGCCVAGTAVPGGVDGDSDDACCR